MVHWWHGVFLIRLTAGYLCWVVPAGLPASCWPCELLAMLGSLCCRQGGAQEGAWRAHTTSSHSGCTGDFGESLSASTASVSRAQDWSHQTARSISLQKRCKPLTVSLNRRFFCIFCILVWSSAICSGPAGAGLADPQGMLQGNLLPGLFLGLHRGPKQLQSAACPARGMQH